MTRVDLTYWEPGGGEARTIPLTGTEQLAVLADHLHHVYEQAHDILPGIELGRPDDGESLSIAVGAAAWALVHTDSDFDQHCTHDHGGDDGSVEVRWEEPTSIPRRWFVARDSALGAVGTWLADGSLDPTITWSSDCS